MFSSLVCCSLSYYRLLLLLLKHCLVSLFVVVTILSFIVIITRALFSSFVCCCYCTIPYYCYYSPTILNFDLSIVSCFLCCSYCIIRWLLLVLFLIVSSMASSYLGCFTYLIFYRFTWAEQKLSLPSQGRGKVVYAPPFPDLTL